MYLCSCLLVFPIYGGWYARTMRVLHVASGLSQRFGGSTSAILGMTRALARNGVEVQLFSTEVPGEDTVIQPQDGLRVRMFPIRFPKRFYYSPAMRRALEETIRYVDLVHVHDIWNYSEVLAVVLARKRGVPALISPHGELHSWALNHRWLRKKIHWAVWTRRALRSATAFHALSGSELRSIETRGIKVPVVVIPNGVDPCDFSPLPPRDELRYRFPELRDCYILLFLGRIHPVKGLDLLVRAFGVIVRQRDDVRLIVVGPSEGSHRNEVVGMLRAEGVLNNVIFTGPLFGREKLAALAAADVFVLTSYSEGFPMAVLEALVCGLPVVVTPNCNFPEVSEAGTGFVVEPDVDAIVHAICTLLDDPALRKMMGMSGQHLVWERFTWDRIAKRLVEAYGSLIQEKWNS